ncbi:MAG TPA: NAD(P)H-dependent oxidoreductase [Terriglobales bacterium]|jgi:FMN reductase|nr:NAD(P)H-dependent oxidoreductase [Terriglobales bacterium]
MKNRLTIVGLGGSLAKRSNSLAALKIALEGATETGAQIELFNIRELAIPMYEPGSQNPPDSVLQMANAMYNADGLIWSSPMYHGTISGSFKNSLDWLQILGNRQPSYLTDKVVGLISTAGGVQGLQAVNTMEFVVRALRGWAVPLVLPIAQAWKAFDEQGKPIDPTLTEQLRALGREVARGSCQFALTPPTKADAAAAEAAILPESDAEAKKGANAVQGRAFTKRR